MDTLRLSLLKVGVIVQRSVRRVVVRLSAAFAHWRLLRDLVAGS